MTIDIDHTIAKVEASAMDLHRERVVQEWLVQQLGPGPWRSADVARERARLMAGWRLAKEKGISTRLDHRPPRPAAVDWAKEDGVRHAGEVRTCVSEVCDRTFEVRIDARTQLYCERGCGERQAARNKRRRKQEAAAG